MEAISFSFTDFLMFIFVVGMGAMLAAYLISLDSNRKRFIELRRKRFSLGLQKMTQTLQQETSTLVDWRPEFDEFISTTLLDSPISFHRAIGSYGSICLARQFKEPNRKNILSDESKEKVKDSLKELEKGLNQDDKKALYSALTNLALITFEKKGTLMTNEELEQNKNKLLKDLQNWRKKIIQNQTGDIESSVYNWLKSEQLEALPPELLVPLIYVRDRILRVHQYSEVLIRTRSIKENRKALARFIGKVVGLLRKKRLDYAKILDYMTKEYYHETKSFAFRTY